jgi:hypothetical protein
MNETMSGMMVGKTSGHQLDAVDESDGARLKVLAQLCYGELRRLSSSDVGSG